MIKIPRFEGGMAADIEQLLVAIDKHESADDVRAGLDV